MKEHGQYFVFLKLSTVFDYCPSFCPLGSPGGEEFFPLGDSQFLRQKAQYCCWLTERYVNLLIHPSTQHSFIERHDMMSVQPFSLFGCDPAWDESLFSLFLNIELSRIYVLCLGKEYNLAS